MRKVVVAAFTSLDGVMQAPGGPEEDTTGGFRFGGWVFPHFDEALGGVIDELLSQPFDLLLGRTTYDIFAAYWPSAGGDDAGIADKFNATTKYVATHHPESLSWRNTKALEGDVADAVRALKREPGDTLLTQGSANLVQQLLAAGLVDELQLMVFPVLLGPGKRLFGEDAAASGLTLEQSKTTPRGVVVMRYARGGEVRTGSFVE